MLATSLSCVLLALQASPTAIPPESVSNFANFGRSVAASGTHLVVGVPGDGHNAGARGSVQFYERSLATGDWIPGLRMEGQNQQRIGQCVAMDGNIAIVGNRANGAVPGRVFERAGAGWVQTGFVQYPGQFPNSALFARSVDVSDGRIVVGAPRAVHGTLGAIGAVYVYEKVGGLWTQTQRLVPPLDPATGEVPQGTRFGERIALDGDTLAISAPNEGNASPEISCRVTVWKRAGGSFALEEAIPAPALPDEHWWGGFGLALQGDTLLVGSHQANFDGVGRSGLLHVYERAGGSWTEIQRLADPLPSIRGGFGAFALIEGDRLVVGRVAALRREAQFERLSLETFSRVPPAGSTPGRWAHEGTIFEPHEAGGTDFGETAALVGESLVMGVPQARVGMEFPGMVYATDLLSEGSSITSIACGGEPCSCPSLVPWRGCQNSARRSGELSAFGSASISADDLVLAIAGLPNGSLARLVLGPGLAPARPFGDGALCVQSPRELAPRLADSTGTLVIPEGLLGRASAQLGAAGQVIVGETWVLQARYDDGTGLFPCSTHQPVVPPLGVKNGRPYLVARGFNLTNGLQVTWKP